MLIISNKVTLAADEIEFSAIRASGAGGQNVNKVSSAIHLRFDINNSSLPERYKEQLLALKDRRVSKDGIIIIKAQKFRTQEKNRTDAIERLRALISSVTTTQKARIPTRASKASKKKRLDNKSRRGAAKALRGKVKEY